MSSSSMSCSASPAGVSSREAGFVRPEMDPGAVRGAGGLLVVEGGGGGAVDLSFLEARLDLAERLLAAVMDEETEGERV